MTKIKSFDCIAMKRAAQEEIFNDIKGMSPEEELAYWHNHHAKHEKDFKQMDTLIHRT